MSLVELLNLLGSLGLFLYGMKVMSDALMKLAGEKMRKIMIRLTSNRVKGVLTGLFITGLIQSSSATTLMVVSFVNAGLLNLTEAISVIMGANIGTTFTAWLISILGFKVKMSSIALPLIIVGFVFYMRKNETQATAGRLVIGFALLFIGLEFMKDAITGIEDNPELYEFFQKNTERGFLGIILFVFIGTVLTLVLQSSSATMAITIVAASQGVLTFEAAAAIVLGENIGTTITANMAAMISGTEARRAAMAHLLFNVVGVIWILILFVPFLRMVDTISMEWMNMNPLAVAKDIPIGLAVFHSSFNLINTTLLLFFVPLLASIVTRIIPHKEVPEPAMSQPRYLLDRYLKYPETAIYALLQETRRLYGEIIPEAIAHGLHIHRSDIRSQWDIDQLLKQRGHPGIKVEDFLRTNLWPISSAILKYGSRIQEAFPLESEDNKKVTRLKRVNRDAREIIVNLQTILHEIDRHAVLKNQELDAQYHKLQHIIVEILRAFLAGEDHTLTHDQRIMVLENLRKVAKKEDVTLLRDIDSLIREEKITSEQGVSLMICSAAVLQISKLLIRATKFLMVLDPKEGVLREQVEPEKLDFSLS
jgi:phosphate:Na+ symporter